VTVLPLNAHPPARPRINSRAPRCDMIPNAHLTREHRHLMPTMLNRRSRRSIPLMSSEHWCSLPLSSDGTIVSLSIRQLDTAHTHPAISHPYTRSLQLISSLVRADFSLTNQLSSVAEMPRLSPGFASRAQYPNPCITIHSDTNRRKKNSNTTGFPAHRPP